MKPIFFLELHMNVHIDNKQEIRKNTQIWERNISPNMQFIGETFLQIILFLHIYLIFKSRTLRKTETFLVDQAKCTNHETRIFGQF